MTIHVRAFWDPEAEVWVAESEDVPGLITEAASLDALKAKLDGLIPELLEMNGARIADQPSPSVELLAEYGISASA